MIKELSAVSLKNPLEVSKNSDIFGGNNNVSNYFIMITLHSQA